MAVSNSTHRPNVRSLIAESFTNTLTIGQNHKWNFQGQVKLPPTLLERLFMQPFFARTISDFLDTTSLLRLKVSAPFIPPLLSIALQRLFYEMNPRERTPHPLGIQHLIESFLPPFDRLCICLANVEMRSQSNRNSEHLDDNQVEHLRMQSLQQRDSSHQSSEDVLRYKKSYIKLFISSTTGESVLPTSSTVNVFMKGLIRSAQDVGDLWSIKFFLNALDPNATALRTSSVEWIQARWSDSVTLREPGEWDQDTIIQYLINRYALRSVRTENSITLSYFCETQLYYCICFFAQGNRFLNEGVIAVSQYNQPSLICASSLAHACRTPALLEHFIELAGDRLDANVLQFAIDEISQWSSTTDYPKKGPDHQKLIETLLNIQKKLETENPSKPVTSSCAVS